MQNIAISELRANLTGFLKRVKAGEVIVITSRGTEIARLVPPDYAMTSAREKLNELRRTAVIGDIVSPIDDSWEANE